MEIDKLARLVTEVVDKSFKLWQVVGEALQNRRLSSVNMRHGIFDPLGISLKPILDFGFWEASVSFLMKASIQRMNRYGEREYP